MVVSRNVLDFAANLIIRFGLAAFPWHFLPERIPAWCGAFLGLAWWKLRFSPLETFVAVVICINAVVNRANVVAICTVVVAGRRSCLCGRKFSCGWMEVSIRASRSFHAGKYGKLPEDVGGHAVIICFKLAAGHGRAMAFLGYLCRANQNVS